MREKQNEVVTAIRAYNAHRAQVMLEAIGTTDEELVEKVRNGELTHGQAMSLIRKQYARLETEEKEQVRAQVKAEVQATNKFRAEGEEAVKAQFLERREERLRERINEADKFNESAVANRLIAQRLNKAEVITVRGVER